MHHKGLRIVVGDVLSLELSSGCLCSGVVRNALGEVHLRSCSWQSGVPVAFSKAFSTRSKLASILATVFSSTILAVALGLPETFVGSVATIAFALALASKSVALVLAFAIETAI